MAFAASSGAHHADQPGDAVDAQLAQLQDRLVIQYAHHGHHNETDVRDQFQRAVQHFANARIRSFLPILIERAVKTKLT
jgi:hypothetical protein